MSWGWLNLYDRALLRLVVIPTMGYTELLRLRESISALQQRLGDGLARMEELNQRVPRDGYQTQEHKVRTRMMHIAGVCFVLRAAGSHLRGGASFDCKRRGVTAIARTEGKHTCNYRLPKDTQVGDGLETQTQSVKV